MSELVAWLQVSGNLSDHDLPIQFGDQTQYVGQCDATESHWL